MKRKLFALLLCVAALLCCTLVVSATKVPQAADISDETTVTVSGYNSYNFLFDKNINRYYQSGGNASITLENAAGIGSLYLMFDYEYWDYTITDNTSGESITAGTYGFLHEFVDLAAAFGYAPGSVTIDFANGAVHLSEIFVFSEGVAPDFVQKWEPPLEGGADILMLPTHGDDDQLYFAGLLPYYAGELDCRVQVVYLTSHRCYTTIRTHEMLNGLWATGVEAYPVFGYNLDFRVDSLEGSYQVYANYGISRDDLIGYVVEQLRRFKPLAVVGHDINGEYGHGMHRVYADVLMAAAEISNDPEAYPELAQEYGVWDVPKTYLHLLEDNPIEINYDIPLESYDGLTAFQVTQKYGFPCHETQQIYRNFWTWLNGNNGEITKATEIEKYNPCKFGLYRSTVGEDVNKDDFLENLTTYAEQERLEQERLEQERLEQERQEAERLEQERLEQERLEAERLEQERQEAERLEQERLAQEEQARLEQEALEAEQARIETQNRIQLIGMMVPAIGGAVLSYRLTARRMKKSSGLYSKKKIKK